MKGKLERSKEAKMGRNHGTKGIETGEIGTDPRRIAGLRMQGIREKLRKVSQ